MTDNFFRKLLLAFACATTAFSLPHSASGQGFFSNSYTVQGQNLDLGYAGRTFQWAALGLNGDVSFSDANSSTVDVIGNVGVAGTGNFSLSGATVQGDVYVRSGGSLNLSSKGSITGSKYQGSTYDAILNHAVTDANSLSSKVAALAPTNTSYTTINATSSFNISDSTGGAVVLKLQDFMIAGGTLTLQGTATTKFIFNVNRYFSLSAGASVVTAGGLLPSNVLFNVTNAGATNNVSLSGASVLNGILLASNRVVSLTGASQVNGEVIGRSVLASGGSKIKLPPRPVGSK